MKSEVKCYLKKTRKKVGGRNKTYQYNQYLVPLKRSDNLQCSEEVFILPSNLLKDILGVAEIDSEFNLEEYLSQNKEYQMDISNYEKLYEDLEWKHRKLSKSYKELLDKYNKIIKTYKDAMERIEVVKEEKEQMKREVNETYQKLQELREKYDRLKKTKEEKEEKEKEKGFMSVFRGRLG